MVPLENPSLFFSYGGGGGFMARINNCDRSSEVSTGDCHSVPDPTADINGTNTSSTHDNNNNNIFATVDVHQEDSRTKEEEDGGIVVRRNSGNNTKTIDSVDGEDHHKGWLRLGIGPDTTKLRGCSGDNARDPARHGGRDQGLLELSLFSSTSTAVAGASSVFHAPPPPLLPHPDHQQLMMRGGCGASFYYQQMFRPPMLHRNPLFLSSSSSSSSLSPSFSPWMPLMGPYNFAPPSQPSSFGVNTNNKTSVDLGIGPSSDFRVVDPPRRPHSGIWFVLQASQNQAKEPFLPQVNKSYLRIKDGRITVRLLIKYLMKKLQLESESEIEISCRGQQLSPFLTMQHVRDNIWSPKDLSSSSPSSPSSSSSSPSFTLLPESSTHHVMILHYGRSA